MGIGIEMGIGPRVGEPKKKVFLFVQQRGDFGGGPVNVHLFICKYLGLGKVE